MTFEESFEEKVERELQAHVGRDAPGEGAMEHSSKEKALGRWNGSYLQSFLKVGLVVGLSAALAYVPLSRLNSDDAVSGLQSEQAITPLGDDSAGQIPPSSYEGRKTSATDSIEPQSLDPSEVIASQGGFGDDRMLPDPSEADTVSSSKRDMDIQQPRLRGADRPGASGGESDLMRLDPASPEQPRRISYSAPNVDMDAPLTDVDSFSGGIDWLEAFDCNYLYAGARSKEAGPCNLKDDTELWAARRFVCAAWNEFDDHLKSFIPSKELYFIEPFRPDGNLRYELMGRRNHFSWSKGPARDYLYGETGTCYINGDAWTSEDTAWLEERFFSLDQDIECVDYIGDGIGPLHDNDEVQSMYESAQGIFDLRRQNDTQLQHTGYAFDLLWTLAATYECVGHKWWEDDS